MGITTLIMNLATLVTKMDDLKDLAHSMHLPRRIATLLVTTYKPVMVTVLQLYTSCSYHMLIVWYLSEMGDEFRKLYNLQKIFDFLGLGSKCADSMSCHGYGLVDTGMRNLLRSRRLMCRDDRVRPHPDGQDGPSEQTALEDIAPSGFSQSSRENEESMVDGEVSTTNSTPRLKIPKSVSFEDSENQHPTVRSNLDTHLSDTPFAIRQPIWRPHLLERVCKPIYTPHWCGDLWSFTTENTRDRV